MHELVRTRSRAVALEQVDHTPRHATADPDVAVDDPDDVALGLAVRATHVADLGVRAQRAALCRLATVAVAPDGSVRGIPVRGVGRVEEGVFGLDEHLDIEIGEVGQELLQHGECGIGACCDAEADRELRGWVDLAEGRGEAGV